MAIDRPRPGACDASIGGKFCGNPVFAPATRCLTHGGAVQLAGGLKESLYTKRLRKSLPSPEDQKLFDEMPKSTDLGEEIRVARMRVIKYEEMLNRGEEFIFSKPTKKPLAEQIAEDGTVDVDKLSVKAISVHDLHRDALQSLRALCVSQDAIHPGSDIGGNLRVTITLAGAAKPRLPIPDLTDDSNAQRLLPPTGATVDVDAVQSTRGGTGYEDDEP